MGRKNEKETSFDTLLNQALDKQGHGRPEPRYAGKAAGKIWPRRHVRLALSLTVLLVVGLGASVWAWQNGVWFTGTGPSGLRAVLVDGLSVSYPNPSFTNNVTKTLSSVGYAVDYIGPDKFTVDTFANLPSQGYSLVIMEILYRNQSTWPPALTLCTMASTGLWKQAVSCSRGRKFFSPN